MLRVEQEQEMSKNTKRGATDDINTDIGTDANADTEIAMKPAKHRKLFNDSFSAILDGLKDEFAVYNLPENGVKWLETLMKETIPGGKLNRGLSVVSSLSSIIAMENRELTEKERQDANVLGWCIEMLQAMFLIQDDIMDGSLTRRGKPCWYRRENVGMIAINDAMVIEMMIYKVLKKYFRDHKAYADFVELFHETTFQTELGQLMDLLTAPEDKVDLSKFSIEKHAYIVEFKTAYYSFFLPIALAMHYAGIKDVKAFDQAKSVLLPLGEYFQVQDDYLDCYGKPETIGKIGTDIEDNKCGWLIVQALSLASTAQRKLLDENYGKKDAANVAVVKTVYNEIGIDEIYKKYESDSYERLCKMIEKVDHELLPRKMFTDFMHRIYKRKA